ncbi:MAG TPA: hypothetical protein VGA70_11765 [Longimicrobiales bacterium]|jgi:hypothetical protein
MFGCIRSCFGRVVGVVLLIGAAYAGWRWGPEVFPRIEGWLGREVASGDESGDLRPSPELAQTTMDRIERFRSGEGGDRLALGGVELASLLRYALPGIIPPGVGEPNVSLSGGRMELSARVDMAAFPELPSITEVLGFLPDTVDIQMQGSLIHHDQAFAAFHVDGVQASRIPLPDRFIPEILRALGRKDLAGLPVDAMLVPLPPGLQSAYVLRDSLVLVAGG